MRYRIDGVLEEATRLSAAVRNPLVARLKVMAQLDIAERRVPQDGGIVDHASAAGPSTAASRRCRPSTARRSSSASSTRKSALVRLDQLGFEPEELAARDECLRQPEGMILTTGPTGSGKTTTLYAMLQAIHSPETNIVTVENPIEYQLHGHQSDRGATSGRA